MDGRKILDVEVVAEELTRLLVEWLPRWKRRSAALADQVERASLSVMLNVGEADGNSRGHRYERLESASGSVSEIRRAVRFALIHGWIDPESAAALDSLCDRESAMLWRMRERVDPAKLRMRHAARR